MNLKGKKILVTGGASGLGFAITKQLLSKDSHVYICGRTKKRLQEAKEKLNSQRLETRVCDVSDYEQIDATVDDIGNIDVLINNAGVWIEGKIEENTPQEINQAIRSNLLGTIFATKAVMPIMKKNKKGYIVNIISKSGVRIHPGQSVYVASKYGARAFTESLSKELRNTGIKLIGIYPTVMNIPGFFKGGSKERKYSDMLDPNEVAKTVIFALEQDSPMLIDRIEINKDNS